MISNYIKLAIRNLMRIKEYFFINVFGLAIGMAVIILVMIHIRSQLNYDNFHPKHNQIYRLYIHSLFAGIDSKAAVTSQRFAFGFKEQIPEIEQACRLFKLDRDIAFNKPIEMNMPPNSLLFVDSTFFDLFGFKLLEGDPATCLSVKRSLVLTQSLAKKLFPDGAMGEKVTVEGGKEWTVTGIVEDCPVNTHLSFKALASFRSIELPDNSWTSNFLYTYVRLKDGTETKPSKQSVLSLSPIEERIMEVFYKEAGADVMRGLGTSIEEIKRKDNFFVIRLQHVSDIHLLSKLKYDLSQNVNIRTILILSGISILILLIACINYANLSTARLAVRVREIGIRKTMGSHTAGIVWQFLAESIIISFISLFFALVVVELAYTQIAGFYPISSSGLLKSLSEMLPVIFLFTLAVGILAGIYPAFYITRFSPAEILRRQKQFGGGSRGVRGYLVIIQFVFSLVIIYSTTTIYRQLRYIQNRGIGFESEKVLVLENTFMLGEKKELFLKDMLAIQGVENGSFSGSVPGKLIGMQSFQLESNKKNLIIAVHFSDSMFVKSYGIELVEGNYAIDRDTVSGPFEILINESAKHYLGVDKAEGTLITTTNVEAKVDTFIVKGVVRDYNFESVHAKVQPLIIIPDRMEHPKYLSLKLKNKSPKLLQDIRTTWSKYLPERSFSEFWIEEEFGLFYKEERLTGQIALLFSFFAILIACMGLYSLLALTTVYRTHEIGIRKVLGAGPRELIFMLTKEIMRLIFVAGLVALPLSYFISDYWLSRFAYHIKFNLANYFIVFIAVFVVAIFTIYRQLWRTINADPAESLRCE